MRQGKQLQDSKQRNFILVVSQHLKHCNISFIGGREDFLSLAQGLQKKILGN